MQLVLPYRIHFIIFLILIGLTIADTHTAAARYYRWVDENGAVHFSDRIPPRAVKLSREVLNSEGIATKVIERAKTPEEVKRAREEERLQAENKRLLAEQRAADQVLLRTFRSEEDIKMARQGKMDAVETQIKVAQSNIRRYQKKLADQQYKQAATLERSAKMVPQSLKAEIDDTLKRISDTYGIIRRKELEQHVIKTAFDSDLKRFRILKNLSNKNQVVAEDSTDTSTSLDNLVPCGEGVICDKAWARAEAFVLKYATTPIQIQGDSIIMSRAPLKNDDISITVSRIKQDKQPVMLFMDLFCKHEDFCKSPKVRSIREAYRREVGINITQ